MKEITVLSGKGGTGKTSITAALASIAQNAVLCDNDVDASDLHLILKPQILETVQFEGSWIAEIDQDKCTQCSICYTTCRFEAINLENNRYTINPFLYEGCRLCERVCPEKAISSKRSDRNYWYISDTRMGTMIHARMAPGEENSGKLVALIRSQAKTFAEATGAQYIINDGPPGIGCSAISSITGTDHVLLVIEPTLSGIHDAERVIELVRNFKIPISAIINKYDLNKEITNRAIKMLEEQQIPTLAKINFDRQFVHAMIKEQSIVEYAPESDVTRQLKYVWKSIN